MVKRLAAFCVPSPRRGGWRTEFVNQPIDHCRANDVGHIVAAMDAVWPDLQARTARHFGSEPLGLARRHAVVSSSVQNEYGTGNP